MGVGGMLDVWCVPYMNLCCDGCCDVGMFTTFPH